MKGRASRAVYMRLQPSLLSPPSDPEEREKKREQTKKKEQKKLHPFKIESWGLGRSFESSSHSVVQLYTRIM